MTATRARLWTRLPGPRKRADLLQLPLGEAHRFEIFESEAAFFELLSAEVHRAELGDGETARTKLGAQDKHKSTSSERVNNAGDAVRRQPVFQ